MSLIRADARQIPLVDGCVQCCVTSPPYWGLRDYGTARWDGGDPACDHRSPSMREGRNEDRPTLGGGIMATNSYQLLYANKQGRCGKCGARRIDSQIGLEPTPDAYVQNMVQVFREVRRVLKDDGTCWIVLGDSYNAYNGNRGASASFQSATEQALPVLSAGYGLTCKSLKPKDLIGIPWRVAFALQADGWYLRSDIIWSKPNPMPESVTDRPTKAHEYIFLLSKRASYYYDAASIAESVAASSIERWGSDVVQKRNPSPQGLAVASVQGESCFGMNGTRNKRSVWHVATQPYPESHFATFPEKLIEPCILAGSRVGDLVFDPFIGSGTTGTVCERLMRRWVGTDLSYQPLAKRRTAQRGLRLEDVDEATA